METAFARDRTRRDRRKDSRRGHAGRKALADLPPVRENVITQGEADALNRANAIVRDAIDVG